MTLSRSTFTQRRLLATLLVTFATTFANAGEEPPLSLDQLSFLTGHWFSQTENRIYEHAWFGPKGGTMVGTTRRITDNRADMFMFFIIEELESGIILRVKHYERDYSTWEGDDPLTFQFQGFNGDRAVFQSLDPEQSPSRAEIGLNETGHLIQHIVGLNDPESVPTFTFDYEPFDGAHAQILQQTQSANTVLSSLHWLSGYWVGELFGGESEEAWMMPAGDTMIGAFRLVHDDRTSVIEFLTIVDEGNAPVFMFKHFNPDYRAWETGMPLTFEQAAVAGNSARFDSTFQNSPNRLHYSLHEDGTLHVLVVGEEEGKASQFEAVYHKTEPGE